MHTWPTDVHDHVCDMYGYRCSTVQGLARRRYDKHSLKMAMRNKVESIHCVPRLKQFHSRTRLIHHITMSSRKCMSVCDNHTNDLDPKVVASLDAVSLSFTKELAAQGFRREHAAGLLPFRLIGPLAIETIEAGIMFHKGCLSPCDQWPELS